MEKLAKNIGSCFDKIDDNWKTYNSTVPEYQIKFDSVVVDFKMEAQSELEKTVEKIISLIKENPNITAKQIEKATILSRRGVEYNLVKL